MELCLKMLPPVNVKAFNNMKSKIADVYVNISLTEVAGDIRLNSIDENLKFLLSLVLFNRVNEGHLTLRQD